MEEKLLKSNFALEFCHKGAKYKLLLLYKAKGGESYCICMKACETPGESFVVLDQEENYCFGMETYNLPGIIETIEKGL